MLALLQLDRGLSTPLNGEYQFLPNTSLWFGYTYERFIYSDYAISASSNPIQYGNALLPGNGNPSYNVHVIGTALRLKF